MKLPFLSQVIYYFNAIYHYTGKKIYALCFIIIIGGITEGVGLSLLLPILDYNSASAANNKYTKFFNDFFNKLGIEINLTILLVMLCTVFSIKGLLKFTQDTYTHYITTEILKNMRANFCMKLAEVKYVYFMEKDIGFLNNVIVQETQRTIASIRSFVKVIVFFIYIIIYFMGALLISWRLTFFVIILSLIVLKAINFLSVKSRKLSRKLTQTNAEIQSLIFQALNNFKYLKATAAFNKLFIQLFRKLEDHKKFTFKIGMMGAVPVSITEPLITVLLTGMIIYYVYYQGQTIADVLVLMLFFYRSFVRVIGFQSEWLGFNATIGAIEVVENVRKEQEINKEKTINNKCKEFRDSIALKNVYFSYASKPVLQNINLVIRKNSFVGIVGESGAGKTTLFDLLTGLLTPVSGSIYLDEIDYKAIDLKTLRSIIGYVTQEPVIFNDSISNNVSLWECVDKDPSCYNDIRHAASLANCSSFIENTINGFDTDIGDKGIKLSGGQRQRIAIAREIFKSPDIIIFDEATSSLDSETEKNVQNSIKEMAGIKTIVLISHRLSTVLNCDYVYVLKDGHIVEEGAPDQLYRRESGYFRNMCKIQGVEHTIRK